MDSRYGLGGVPKWKVRDRLKTSFRASPLFFGLRIHRLGGCEC